MKVKHELRSKIKKGTGKHRLNWHKLRKTAGGATVAAQPRKDRKNGVRYRRKGEAGYLATGRRVNLATYRRPDTPTLLWAAGRRQTGLGNDHPYLLRHLRKKASLRITG